MSDLASAAVRSTRSIRTFLLISGIVTLIAGIVVLIWPAKSAVIVTAIVASYLIVGGLIYIGLGIFSRQGGGWMRALHILLGVLYIAAGVIAFVNLPAATVTFALVVAIFIGVNWIVDGFVAFSLLSTSKTRVWTVVYALLSIVAGVFVLLSPLYAAVILWIVLGISMIVLGIGQIVRAVTLKNDAVLEHGTVDAL